jgi:hypothetical protein
MPIISAGDFNFNVKDNYNAELVELMGFLTSFIVRIQKN